ncbi:hypothetical protein, partial [Xanthomonas oryzae]
GLRQLTRSSPKSNGYAKLSTERDTSSLSVKVSCTNPWRPLMLQISAHNFALSEGRLAQNWFHHVFSEKR